MASAHERHPQLGSGVLLRLILPDPPGSGSRQINQLAELGARKRTGLRPATGPPATPRRVGCFSLSHRILGSRSSPSCQPASTSPGSFGVFAQSMGASRPLGQAVSWTGRPIYTSREEGTDVSLGRQSSMDPPKPSEPPLGSMLALQENAPHPRRQARDARQMPRAAGRSRSFHYDYAGACGAGSPDVGRRSAVEPSAPPMDGMRAPDEGLPAPDLRARLPPTLSSVRRDTDGTVGDAHRHDNRLRMAIGAVGRIAS